MYKYLIFDLDGTLLNTLDDLFIATNYALQKHGYPVRSYQEIRQFVGNGIELLIKRALPSADCEFFPEVFKSFKDYYEIHKMDHTAPYPGIAELLKYLSNLGIKMAIVSNKYHDAVQEICEPLFGEYIFEYIGETPNLQKKPAPDMLIKVMNIIGANKQETLFIGDGETDIMTAVNAGVKMCAVTWGFRDEPFLKTFPIDFIVNTPSDIIKIIKENARH